LIDKLLLYALLCRNALHYNAVLEVRYIVHYLFAQ